jgi:hypothetical protein
MDKDRAIEIIQAALYADPMMDEVIMVKEILARMPLQYSTLLVSVAAGVPMQLYRNFVSYKVLTHVKVAAELFIKEIDKLYVSE